MLDLIVVGLLQAVAGPPAEAQTSEPAAQQTTQEAAPADAAAAERAARNERRCRVDNITGSRLGARVCNSQAEREGLEREGRTFLEDGMRMWDSRSTN